MSRRRNLCSRCKYANLEEPQVKHNVREETRTDDSKKEKEGGWIANLIESEGERKVVLRESVRDCKERNSIQRFPKV